MLVINCENCGKQFEMQNTDTSAVCPHCGTEQVPPRMRQFLEEERKKRIEIQKRTNAIIAKEKARKRKIIWTSIISTVSIIALIVVGINLYSYIDKSLTYKKASDHVRNGEYREAYELFNTLGEFKDSENRCKTLEVAMQKQTMLNTNVGGIIKFGSYEQDGNFANGQEEIEWVVLAKDSNKMLVMTNDCIEQKKYNETYVATTWDTSDLRKWLNNEFIQTAFSDEQKDYLLTTTVKAEKNPVHHTHGGYDTEDKVFILSASEYEKYCTYDEAKLGQINPYVVSKGAYENLSLHTGHWWLRTPGIAMGRAAYVTSSGTLTYYGEIIESVIYCVRPVMWIDVSINEME